ncbi:unnamed protein product [Acanthoscelides obtectus]|uniref:Uncharacterized protein n=1 Tax=Acanthoscelides obtectus TaxID=200917 RepID=A0A9P0PZ00_ACAOB|nr:unnamed protein product [Acanthoscelides obtectus]CAK1620317.1 hypothetical protein AOBTE_LOCUS304 [Acanthoscelides obtectus]
MTVVPVVSSSSSCFVVNKTSRGVVSNGAEVVTKASVDSLLMTVVPVVSVPPIASWSIAPHEESLMEQQLLLRPVSIPC